MIMSTPSCTFILCLPEQLILHLAGILFLDVTTTVISISVSLPETCYIVLVGLLCGLSLVLAFNLPTRWHSRNHLIPPTWGRVIPRWCSDRQPNPLP